MISSLQLITTIRRILPHCKLAKALRSFHKCRGDRRGTISIRPYSQNSKSRLGVAGIAIGNQPGAVRYSTIQRKEEMTRGRFRNRHAEGPLTDEINEYKHCLFSDQLQVEFAKFSGDRNPLHMDPVAARRTPAGRPVVHGMHAVLRSLETVAALSPGLSPPFKLSARFLKPVYVGDGVAISVADRTNADLRIQMRVDGIIAIDLHLTLSSFSRSTEVIHTFAVERAHVCRELSLSEMEGRSGAVSSAVTARRELVF